MLNGGVVNGSALYFLLAAKSAIFCVSTRISGFLKVG
jgi:hypothetical protein